MLASRRSLQHHRSVSNMASLANNTDQSNASREAEGVIIVGAGIAGLSCAAALRSIAGITSVHVLEKFDEPTFRNERAGAGAQLGPNGLRALRAIGGEALVDEIMRAGSKLSGNAIMMPTPPGTMKIPDTAESDTGLPQVFLRWGKLREILAQRLPPGSITLGADIVGYQSSEEGVILETESGKPVPPTKAPLVIAADGIYSKLRSSVQDDVKVKYNKRFNFKASVKLELGDEFEPGYTYCYFAPGGGTACFAGPAGDGYTYWAISIADNDEDPSSELLTLAHKQSNCDDNSAALKEELLKTLRSLNEPLCQFAIDKVMATEPGYIYLHPSEQLETLAESFVSKDGKLVLVGDAAHAMSPAYGQGSNFALEDAATLAVFIRDGDNLREALDAYGASRVGRCMEMQHRSEDRAVKAMKGEQVEDVSKWIFKWDVSEKGGKIL